MSAVEVDQRPPVNISRPQRALAELQADLIADRLADRLLDVLPATNTDAGVGVPSRHSPVSQQLINGRNATGADSVYTVALEAILPLSVMCRLTTDNTVADRKVAVEFRDADGLRFLVAGTQAVVQASSQQSFVWYPHAGGVAWPVEDAAISPLPQQYLFAGMQLALKVWNGAAGDVLDQVRISVRLETEALSGD